MLFFFHLESLPGQFVPILSHILFGRTGGKLSHNFQIHLNFSLSPRHLVERRQQCCRLVRCTNKNKIKLKKPQPSCKKSAILRKPPAFQLEHKQLLIWDSSRVNRQPRAKGAAGLVVSHKPRPPRWGTHRGEGKERVGRGNHPQTAAETSPEEGRRSAGSS